MADHDGVMHGDNLERLVEIKFFDDPLSRAQEQDYTRIAGGLERFTVLEIRDCRDKQERDQDREYNREHRPTEQYDSSRWPSLLPGDPDRPSKPAPIPVPAYGPEPAPRPARVESWTQQVQAAVDGLLEQGAQGIRQLSQEVRQHLEDAATWLGAEGQWVRRESQKAWEWVSETGAQVLRWTDEQLCAIWVELQWYADLTLETLRQVDWVQVLIELGVAAATVVVAIGIGAALTSVAIPAAIVSGLMLIIHLARVAWAALALILTAAGTAIGTAAVTAN